MRIRHALALTAVGLAFLPAATADAKTSTCKSADLRYPFQPGGPKTFGVFRLRVTGGSCTTAHRVAKAWMTKFEANIDNGSGARPKSAAGFTLHRVAAERRPDLPPARHQAKTRINFDYVIPNG